MECGQWGFHLPSHGKGPWYGVGAVVKMLLNFFPVLQDIDIVKHGQTFGYSSPVTTPKARTTLHGVRDVELVMIVNDLKDKHE